MIININSREYQLIFGVGFVRTLDEKYFIKNQAGMKFGTGLSQRIPSLLTHDPVTLAEFLYEGTCTEDKKPTQKEIDAYIDNCEDMEALFDEVCSELKKANATRKMMKDLTQELEEETAKRKPKARK